MTALVLRGDARHLPLPDESVDLIVTSPPYFALRSYTDRVECYRCYQYRLDGRDLRQAWRDYDAHVAAEHKPSHYGGQIGSEPTPGEYIDNLIGCTREWMRVLKPTGSLWVNLGDKYSGSPSGPRRTGPAAGRHFSEQYEGPRRRADHDVPQKSLIGLPWRYALRCIDTTTRGQLHADAVRAVLNDLADGTINRGHAHRRIDELEAAAATGSPGLGLILRAEVIWSKVNGLPESVRDRVRRSHEQWFHMVRRPRYFAAVDEIRVPHTGGAHSSGNGASRRWVSSNDGRRHRSLDTDPSEYNPLGALPGSVWTVATQPLKVPAELGIDHFAAFPMELPRRIILGWSPSGICTACGEGRRPVASRALTVDRGGTQSQRLMGTPISGGEGRQTLGWERVVTLTGEACACPDTAAPTRPSVVLDPFSGTGTTVLAAKTLGRTGIGVDMSADYCRLATWRVNDPGQIASAMEVEKPPKQVDDQLDLFAEVVP